MNNKSKYTVLLLYPDYLADNYGESTCLHHVKASDGKEAVRLARKECVEWQEPGVVMDPEAFVVLFLCHDWVKDLTGTVRW